MTQRDAILQHLRTGQSLTPLQALAAYGCFRLAARIGELRQAGHGIEVKKVETAGGKKVAQYRLVGALQ